MSAIKQVWFYVRWVVLVGSLVVLIGLLRKHTALTLTPPDGDFLQYWAAARFTLQDENPFILERVYALWRTTGWTKDWALVMYNPPWVLGLMLPLGALPAQVAWGVWQVVLFGIIFFASVIGWRWYGGEARQQWVAWVLALTFMPSLLILSFGQLGALVLVGALLWVAGVRYERAGLAGAGLALLTFKPYVLYLFWPAVLIWCWKGRRWQPLLALAGWLAGIGDGGAYAVSSISFG